MSRGGRGMSRGFSPGVRVATWKLNGAEAARGKQTISVIRMK